MEIPYPVPAGTAARLLDRIARGALDDCWPIGNSGYGRFKIGAHTHGAHRVVWTMLHGPIPDGLVVCHRCDYPPCCNPRHLFLGTYRDNAVDTIQKGRHARRGPRKLTVEQVQAIRQERGAGGTLRVIADRHGVTDMTVHKIATRRMWREVA
jgi:hypothetical protein